MKLFIPIIVGLTFLLTDSNPVQAKGWALSQAQESHEIQLTYSNEQAPIYLFACEDEAIRITNYGVTELMDVQTGKYIGDDAEAVVTSGASMMAFYAGNGQPDFVQAEAIHNPVRGWDLTIRYNKSDKRLRSLGKAKMISLFTTGYTMAVEMESKDQSLARDFLKQCSAAG